MTHVAWSCDGKKLAAVGMDKITRVWNPEKSVSCWLFHLQWLFTNDGYGADGSQSGNNVLWRSLGRRGLCLMESDAS